jgi:hypothetical protein
MPVAHRCRTSPSADDLGVRSTTPHSLTSCTRSRSRTRAAPRRRDRGRREFRRALPSRRPIQGRRFRHPIEQRAPGGHAEELDQPRTRVAPFGTQRTASAGTLEGADPCRACANSRWPTANLSSHEGTDQGLAGRAEGRTQSARIPDSQPPPFDRCTLERSSVTEH